MMTWTNEADLSGLSDTELRHMAATATTFLVWTLDECHSYDVTVEYRGKGRWGIYMGGSVFNREVGEFGYESMPSSRTDKMLKATRYDSLSEAMAAARFIGEKLETEWNEYVSRPIGKRGYFAPQSV